MTRNRLLAIATSTLLLFAFGMPSAQASNYKDPPGDMTGAGDQRGDLGITGVAYGHDQTGLAAGTYIKEDPMNWGPGSFVGWTVYTSKGGEYAVLYEVIEGSLTVVVHHPDGSVNCFGAGQYQPQLADPYIATVKSSCLGSPERLVISTTVNYRDHAGAETSDFIGKCCESTPT